ncbi:DUF2961 domain-containing protein [Puteibacter caeruleilacunae]|nr:DUF2961 domain-containing protein [Puteibacter caeruleilacunae]
MDNLFMMSDAETRSISPENITGEKGQGGRISPEEGNAKRAAKKHGWKANPYIFIEPGEEKVLADINGSGIINHIWMTPGRDGNDRLRIIRIYWDGETNPSVEVPVGDFFCNAWGSKNQTNINSLAVCVNPLNGFNCFWQMPFRKQCKITMANLTEKQTTLYYQVDYTVTKVPKNAAYFHAQFNRVKKVPFKKEYIIADNIKGRGQYVGTFLSRGTRSDKWWGEGEVQMFIDGDTDYPTINGTGEEDYFMGSYAYKKFMDNGWKNFRYVDYNTAYAGFHQAEHKGEYVGCFGQYRWHIYDPIRFKSDFKIQIQCLGWDDEGNYLPLEDDMSSVAFWYQTEPHQQFPELPSKEVLNVNF